MGMDVYGKNEGSYFRRNVWGWRRLANCVMILAPDESAPCKHWQSNDGDGLDEAESIALADKLDELIADGTVHEYVVNDGALIEAATAAGDKFANWYTLDADDVKQFSAFVRTSGGFRIN